MNGFGAPAGGFGKAPGGFGAPAAGGFGKAPAPAAGGFGAPNAPAAGGFGKAPNAAPGGFGAPNAPAAGGFGAKAPGVGGFGGAPAAGAGGFGAPAAGGFGAPAAGGFGKAPAGPGGFGAPAGGFAAQSAAQQGAQQQAATAQELKELEARMGELGPGYVPKGQAIWSANVDLSALRDDMLFEELPPSVQEHVAQLHAFIRNERKQHEAMITLTKTIESDTHPESLRTFERKLHELISGPKSAEAAISEAREVDARAHTTARRIAELQRQIATCERQVWEPLRLKGEDHWLYNRNAQEPPSEIMMQALLSVGRQMESADAMLRELESTVSPSSRTQGDGSVVDLIASAPDAPYYLGLPTNNLTGGGMPDGAGGRFVANINTSKGELMFGPTGAGAGLDIGAPSDNAAAVVVALDNELATLTRIAARVAATSDLTQQLKEHFARRHTLAVAKSLFATTQGHNGVTGFSSRRELMSDVLKGRQGSYHYDFTASDTSDNRYNHSRIGPARRPTYADPNGGDLVNAMTSAAGAQFMHYDVTIAARTAHQKAATTAATTTTTTAATTAPAAGAGFGAAPAPATGGAPATGFGATPAAAPAAGGFGAAPAAGGAPAPAAGGFGKTPAPNAAPAAAAPAGFGAPPAGGAAAPAAGGFAKGQTPAPGAGFGAAPAPATGGAPATGFGATPAAAPAAGGFGAAPAAGGAPQGFGGAPAPAAGGFGKAPASAGGFGAAPVAAAPAGFGKAPAAAGGFGAPAGNAGFGKAPAPGGFGAPGGFAAPVTAGLEGPGKKQPRTEDSDPRNL